MRLFFYKNIVEERGKQRATLGQVTRRGEKQLNQRRYLTACKERSKKVLSHSQKAT